MKFQDKIGHWHSEPAEFVTLRVSNFAIGECGTRAQTHDAKSNRIALVKADEAPKDATLCATCFP